MFFRRCLRWPRQGQRQQSRLNRVSHVRRNFSENKPRLSSCIGYALVGGFVVGTSIGAALYYQMRASAAANETTTATKETFASKPTASYKLPRDKLAQQKDPSKTPLVLIACGSFSPITNMHLRLFELAKFHFEGLGYEVLGGYFSPVADAYKKPGLVSASHRLEMTRLAVQTSTWLMVDTWEAQNPLWTPTVQVLDHFSHELNKDRNAEKRKIETILVCGSDLLDSFNKPGLWDPADMEAICKYGIACVARAGVDAAQTVENHALLNKWKNRIFLIQQWIPNDISSTRIRKALASHMSVLYLLPDPVVKYIADNDLYQEE